MCQSAWQSTSQYQGQSFQGSRPLPPFTARIITEPLGSLTVIPSDLFQVPTSAACLGSRLVGVNAMFSIGVAPAATQEGVVVVKG
jgi:hypothetical protein